MVCPVMIQVENLEPWYTESNGIDDEYNHNIGKDRSEENVPNSMNRCKLLHMAFDLFAISAMLSESGSVFSKANYINAV